MPVVHFGTLAHLRDNPFEDSDALEIVESGAILVDGVGSIIQAGERSAVFAQGSDAERVDHGDAWLIPGLIDGHIHYPQYYATAARGQQLLDWLENSIFPAEAAIADPELAIQVASRFVRHVLACGTTTAAAFGSQFLAANLALFEAARSAGLRLIAGMTMMDRQGPPELLQSPQQARDHAEILVSACRDEPLLHYAVTPRFALSCSPAMMEACGELLRAHPQCYLQTHINENRSEIAAVARQFPQSRDYLEVYERFGLISERTLLAHNVHVGEDELARLGSSGCTVCHCASSNLYLGSGLFSLRQHLQNHIAIALGTDIGAGLHFSIWEELSEVYKIQQLQGFCMSGGELLYLGTLGGAKALRLDHETGNFSPGKSADFFVLDLADDGYLTERLRRCESFEQRLFCLLQLASARHIRETYVRGRLVARRSDVSSAD
ncbi:MAG: guanine deaminase [Chromatiales bacterium]|nr:guanine deaminase [Chromatiales bacterium]